MMAETEFMTTDLSDAHQGLRYLAPGYQDFGGIVPP
jgi:hypothetical protein